MTLGDIGVPPADPTGGPDLVQLLTPEGERVDHPDYPLDVSADECRDLAEGGGSIHEMCCQKNHV